MTKRLFLILFTCVLSLHASADWDPAFEAREEAKRKAAQQEESHRQAAARKMVHEASMKGMRQQLGREAVGRSDAEVEKLYQQRMADYQKQGATAAANAVKMDRDIRKLDADTRAERDAQMKAMTGKSVTELHNMSDKELEAYSREMEKRFGVK